MGLWLSPALLIAEVGGADGGSPTEAIEAAIAERDTFGLKSDYETVASLLGSDLDVGTSKWGIAMTVEEETAVDLPSRMTFAGRATETAIPFAQALPNYAGAYFDQARGGILVVVLVGDGHEKEKDVIAGLLPRDGLGVEFRSATYTLAQLVEGWSAVREAWQSDIQLISSSVDEAANLVQLNVSSDDLAAAALIADELAASVGVPVRVAAADASQELACTSRENCADPMRAGNIVRNDSDTGFRCTMGFHMSKGVGGDKQFVTAGHCQYPASTPNDWYHQGMPGNGYIGDKTKNVYTDGVDIVRIQMPDTEVSKAIHGSAWLVKHSRHPVSGEGVCVSLGVTDFVDCGNVGAVLHTWGPSGTACGCVQQGAQVFGIVGQPGDSGSPVYTIVDLEDVALGSYSRAQDFAEIHDALDLWTNDDWKVHGAS